MQRLLFVAGIQANTLLCFNFNMGSVHLSGIFIFRYPNPKKHSAPSDTSKIATGSAISFTSRISCPKKHVKSSCRCRRCLCVKDTTQAFKASTDWQEVRKCSSGKIVLKIWSKMEKDMKKMYVVEMTLKFGISSPS